MSSTRTFALAPLGSDQFGAAVSGRFFVLAIRQV